MVKPTYNPNIVTRNRGEILDKALQHDNDVLNVNSTQTLTTCQIPYETVKTPERRGKKKPIYQSEINLNNIKHRVIIGSDSQDWE